MHEGTDSFSRFFAANGSSCPAADNHVWFFNLLLKSM
jgi:hypothetical protein